MKGDGLRTRVRYDHGKHIETIYRRGDSATMEVTLAEQQFRDRWKAHGIVTAGEFVVNKYNCVIDCNCSNVSY